MRRAVLDRTLRSTLLARSVLGLALGLLLGVAPRDAAGGQPGLSARERLGRAIFFDQGLSANRNQGCDACHGRAEGWTGPDAELNQIGGIYAGSHTERFGNRKPPSSAYATMAPVLTYDATEGFRGGNFWDGRGTGWRLGSAAADQAMGPLLNPLEQALPGAREVAAIVCTGSYSELLRTVWGADVCDDADRAYAAAARSIAAYEASPEVNSFSSLYDAYLAGRERLPPLAAQGLQLFTGKATCTSCHTVAGTKGAPSAFTDFSFDNIGIPPNRDNPFYRQDTVLVDGAPINPLGRAWVDPGLGGFLETLSQDEAWRAEAHVPPAVRALSAEDLRRLATASRGKHRVPTLRNVAKRPSGSFPKAYMHNGYFKSLPALVHFYNTRDVLPRCPTDLGDRDAISRGCWPAPEVQENVNRTIGNLGLTPAEEQAVVAFLETLSDRP